MLTVNSAFSAEERDTTRQPVHDVEISWKKSLTGTNKTNFRRYQYNDETAYLLGLDYERELNMPLGGITKALADARFDNTSGRFTPRYMGGTSAIFTAIEPRKPIKIQAGFKLDGHSSFLPQFVGLIERQPMLDMRGETMELHAVDWVDFLQNKYIDQETMFTNQTADLVIQTLLNNIGFTANQYSLDTGINVINFGLFNAGTKAADAIDKLVQAEYGHFYQDEDGILRFENRQHWTNSPHNAIQRIITTNQVIYSQGPADDHIVNTVEIKSSVRQRQPEQILYRMQVLDSILVNSSSTQEVFVDFEDPALSITVPTSGGTTSYFKANSASDGTGTDLTANLTVSKSYKFAQSVRLNFTNSSAIPAYITELVISGRPAKEIRQIYHRAINGPSRTAYDEQAVTIENNYIQSEDWAQSFAQLILNDFATPQNLQTIAIRAIPELQMGDLISWQGRYWRIYGIRTTFDPESGFIQELKLLQRNITSYFRIGISTIGGTDQIAP